ESMKEMQTIVNDLLEFSSIETADIKLKPVDTSVTLAHALANLKTEIDENKVRVTYDEPMPTVQGDRTQVIRLFQNLVENAIKFRSEKPPEIHISVRLKDSKWEFAVQDNGIGIDPQYHKQIFDIFKRLHGKSEYPGTGMALGICKRIVERMGGEIWIESEPGRGSTFCFTIPVREGGQE
ncbi:MAG TPA: ATP-binding protein, partial [Thermodesulfovibrionales bacterium]|nr:ATP-binding protein [Thermodesulfovibrionales bacterium]